MDSFVVTLQVAEDQQQQLDALRTAHFPARLNKVPAHITLFHFLPRDRAAVIDAEFEKLAAVHPVFEMRVTGLRHLGRGVAYTLHSDELQAIHARLAETFKDDLNSQDRQRYSPHIVIQNKVDAEKSRALFLSLSANFEPFVLSARGLLLWNYLGGPWELAASYCFQKPSLPTLAGQPETRPG